MQQIEKTSDWLEQNFLPTGKEIPEMAMRQINALQKAAYANSRLMSREEWLQARNEGEGGLGGSNASTIMGVNPFDNVVTLYLELVGKIKNTKEENWFRLEYGHATEPLIAKLFGMKFKAAIINDCGMYKHPVYDFIRANMDRLAVLPTGELVIVECKSTNAFAKSVWENGAPEYYVWQGRHYLLVINEILRKAGLPIIKKVYFSALYGNTEEEVIFRKIELDEIIESALLEAEKKFWFENVEERKLPKFNGKGRIFKELNLTYRMELAELNQAMGRVETDSQDSPVELDKAAQAAYDELVIKKAEIDALKAQVKAIEDDANHLEGEIIAALNGADEALLPCGVKVAITTKAWRSTDFEMLKEVYPDAYADCVKESRTHPSLSFKKPTKKKTEGKTKGVA